MGTPAPDIRGTIWDHQWAFTQTVVLRTGIRLGVFAAVHAGRRTAASVARACRAPVAGVRRVLDALVGMRLLRKRGERYRLAPGAGRYLVPGRPEYLGVILGRSERMMEEWASLPRAVAAGRPLERLDQAVKGEGFYPELAAALYSATLETADRTARALGAGSRLRNLRILDVAAGSGVWGLAFAARDRGARVTTVDFPAVLRVTRKFVRRRGLSRRFSYLPGDIRALDFGRARYDLAILGQICHSEGPAWTRRLLRKAARCLVPGGHLLIADFLPDDARTAPLFPLIFSLHMFLMTREGDTFRMADFRRWLRQAGFRPPRRLPGIRPPATILHARKP